MTDLFENKLPSAVQRRNDHVEDGLEEVSTNRGTDNVINDIVPEVKPLSIVV